MNRNHDIRSRRRQDFCEILGQQAKLAELVFVGLMAILLLVNRAVMRPFQKMYARVLGQRDLHRQHQYEQNTTDILMKGHVNTQYNSAQKSSRSGSVSIGENLRSRVMKLQRFKSEILSLA